MADNLGGRPTKYKEEYAAQAEKLCKLGATNVDLAEFFGVAVSTISLWKVCHESFSDALKIGKDAADERVAQALFSRAVGYSHEEDDIRTVSLGNDQGSEIVITPTIKHYPPDTTAGIFWLKNRRPDEWRANPEEKGATDSLSDAVNKLIDKLPD